MEDVANGKEPAQNRIKKTVKISLIRLDALVALNLVANQKIYSF